MASSVAEEMELLNPRRIRNKFDTTTTFWEFFAGICQIPIEPADIDSSKQVQH